MTKITITKNVGGHEAGDTIEVTQGVAALLTNGGYAEVTQATPKRKPKAATDTSTTPNSKEGGGASQTESS